MSKLQRLGTSLLRVVKNRWSIIFGVTSIVAGFAHRWLFPNSSPELLYGVLIALFVVLMLIQRVYVLESANEPALTLKFDWGQNEYRKMGCVKYLPDVPAVYVLVLPVVTSRRNLHRCVGRLADISVFDAHNGRWRAVAYGTSLPLSWDDHTLETAFEPLTLHGGGASRQFLDVFSISSARNWITIDELPRVNENEINIASKCRLALSVVAEDENVSATIVLEVEKTKDWAAPKVRVVDDLLNNG